MLKSVNKLMRTHAVKELARLDQIREIVAAAKEGSSQTAIARDAQISQPEVHRILRRVGNFPEIIERTPREVIFEWVTGKISHYEMMEELEGWSYTFAEDVEPENPEGTISRGSWDQVADAAGRGFLDEHDYEILVNRIRPKM